MCKPLIQEEFSPLIGSPRGRKCDFVPDSREEPMSDTVKYLLDETRLPKVWYNIVADLPRPPEPVLHPGTLQPVGPQDLESLFPMALIQQEVSAERAIEIP